MKPKHNLLYLRNRKKIKPKSFKEHYFENCYIQQNYIIEEVFNFIQDINNTIVSIFTEQRLWHIVTYKLKKMDNDSIELTLFRDNVAISHVFSFGESLYNFRGQATGYYNQCVLYLLNKLFFGKVENR